LQSRQQSNPLPKAMEDEEECEEEEHDSWEGAEQEEEEEEAEAEEPWEEEEAQEGDDPEMSGHGMELPEGEEEEHQGEDEEVEDENLATSAGLPFAPPTAKPRPPVRPLRQAPPMVGSVGQAPPMVGSVGQAGSPAPPWEEDPSRDSGEALAESAPSLRPKAPKASPPPPPKFGNGGSEENSSAADDQNNSAPALLRPIGKAKSTAAPMHGTQGSVQRPEQPAAPPPSHLLSSGSQEQQQQQEDGSKVTEVLSFEKSAMKAILGPAAARVKEVRAQSGAEVRVKGVSESCEVQICGTREQVQKAIALVREAAESSGDAPQESIKELAAAAATDDSEVKGTEDEVFVTMSQQDARKLIGKGGATIKRIRFESGAAVKIDPQSETCVCNIRGTVEAVDRARAMVCQLMRTAGNGVDVKFEAEEYVCVSFDDSKRLIGKAGANVKKIEQDTWAKVDIEKLEDDTRLVRVTGSFDAVDQAISKIEETKTWTKDSGQSWNKDNWSKDWDKKGSGSNTSAGAGSGAKRKWDASNNWDSSNSSWNDPQKKPFSSSSWSGK